MMNCIGCGVCVTVCAGEALALAPRPERKEPFRDFRALVRQQFMEKLSAGEAGSER